LAKGLVNAKLTIPVRYSVVLHQLAEAVAMYEVTRYQPPFIFVTSRRTGETYKFGLDNDGALLPDPISIDSGHARRTAIQYLDQKARRPS
jgi:hypothetical protein